MSRLAVDNNRADTYRLNLTTPGDRDNVRYVPDGKAFLKLIRKNLSKLRKQTYKNNRATVAFYLACRPGF